MAKKKKAIKNPRSFSTPQQALDFANAFKVDGQKIPEWQKRLGGAAWRTTTDFTNPALLGNNLTGITEVDYQNWANPKNRPDRLTPEGALIPDGLTAKKFLMGSLKDAGVKNVNPNSAKFKNTLKAFREKNRIKKGEFIAPSQLLRINPIEKAYRDRAQGGTVFMDWENSDLYTPEEMAKLEELGYLNNGEYKFYLESRNKEKKAAPTDFDKALKDPTTQYFLNEALGGFRGETAQLKEQLANLYTGTFGETGAVKQFDTQSLLDQRRLAAEMAARGTLQSGAYAGGQRGLGTQQQQVQAAQRADIEKGYNSQTSPEYLFERGLARNPDGTVRELVEGETITWQDPATGETKSKTYSWMDTSFGRQAKQAALQQWMQKQLSGVTSVI